MDLDIVYVVDNAQQFWSELEDILIFPKHFIPSLSQLDSALKRYVALCASYHEQYLQNPMQLDHACQIICDSELFVFHSERMCEHLVDELRLTTNPHTQLIIYQTLLTFGRRRTDFLRSHKRWQPLIPLLMDHVLVELGPDLEEYHISHSSSINLPVPVPIEVKLRNLGVNLLYEVCRVQQLSMSDLRIFDDHFLDHLFDLVEQTRDMADESFNYAVIKLIIALNEQFMVATLGQEGPKQTLSATPDSKNRVLRVLIRRLGSSKTFGGNMIFMLNRADRTAEDLCMQLLVLKILYLLFTTPGTSEYFYTNDLCVLVDVFLRELVDLDEDRESLRHTYLRVLHPLLTRTQLKDVPYKRPQILDELESLLRNSGIRQVNPTTKRLVERCLNGEWCVQLRKTRIDSGSQKYPFSALEPSTSMQRNLLDASKSMENLSMSAQSSPSQKRGSLLDTTRRPSNASSSSFTGVAQAQAPHSHLSKNQDSTHSARASTTYYDKSRHRLSDVTTPETAPATTPRRSAPPPPKRRKPPAVPIGLTNSGATITRIK